MKTNEKYSFNLNISFFFTHTHRPNTGLSQFEEDRNDLFSKYEQIEPKDAEEGWTEQYVNTQEKCIHGDTCKHKGSCTSECKA